MTSYHLRTFINLVERAETAAMKVIADRSVRATEPVGDAVKSLHHYIDLIEGRCRVGSSLTVKELRSRVDAAINMLSSEETVPHSFIKEIAKQIAVRSDLTVLRIYGLLKPSELRTDHMGQHWTTEWDALSHNKNMYSPKNSKLYVIQARIDTDAIDVPMTIAYRYLFPEECELFLRPGADVHLMGLYEYPDGEKPIVGSDGRYLFWGFDGYV